MVRFGGRVVHHSCDHMHLRWYIYFMEKSNDLHKHCPKIHSRNMMHENIEGFRPEWYISTMTYSQDIPFWSETLNIIS